MIQAKPTVLILDDDARLRALLDNYLTQKGFITISADGPHKARAYLRTQTPDIIVLDVMMPGEDGLSFLQWLRNQNSISAAHNIPVLLLTALGESHNRIQGLEMGADDYLVKPFEPRELVLRLHNLCKRAQPTASSQHISFGAFSYDLQQQILMQGQTLIHLTTSEHKLLTMLLSQPGRPLTRDALAQSLGLSLSPRSVDVQMTRLRKKIEMDPKKPVFLCTARHEGYVFRQAHIVSQKE